MRVDDPMLSIAATQRRAFGQRRRNGAEGAPSSLKFVGLRPEGQQLPGNVNGVGGEHTRNYAGLYRIVYRKNHLIKPVMRQAAL